MNERYCIHENTGTRGGSVLRDRSNFQTIVIQEKGRNTLHLQLDGALYGCVQLALLWYEVYSTTLKDLGFVLNP